MVTSPNLRSFPTKIKLFSFDIFQNVRYVQRPLPASNLLTNATLLRLSFVYHPEQTECFYHVSNTNRQSVTPRFSPF
jgi:hypothetical protein